MKKILLITALCCAFSVSAQFRLVKDCKAGTDDGYPNGFFEFNGKLLFSATYSSGVRQLWGTDGTAAGTIPMTNQAIPSQPPLTGFIDGTPVDHVIINGELYFEKFTNGMQQEQFQIYKLPSSGIDIISYANGAQAFPGQTTFTDRFYEPVVLGNDIIFTPAISSASAISEPVIIKSDGTASILKDINTTGGSSPLGFKLFNNEIFFSATDNIKGRELWKTDGTEAGTILFQDINIDVGDSNPDQFNILGSQLTFAADYGGVIGRELFKTNGSTGSLVLIRNINPGAGNSDPSNIVRINQTLYFSADNGTVGHELWLSNGNSSGTVLIKDINASGSSYPSKFTKVGTDVYFIADDGVNGEELWKTDGTTAGTVLVKDINPSGNSGANFLTEYNNKLYFSANDGTNGIELWVSDGTTAGTNMLELNQNGHAQVSFLYVFNNELYFAGNDGISNLGQELWAYKDPLLTVNDYKLNGKAVTLYPNPSNNIFQLQTEAVITSVEVYSLLGKKVKTFGKQNQYEINDLAKGMYIVKISSEEHSINKTLVIK